MTDFCIYDLDLGLKGHINDFNISDFTDLNTLLAHTLHRQSFAIMNILGQNMNEEFV